METIAVIVDIRLLCLQFVCLCFDCLQLYLVKQENYHFQCASCRDIIDTSFQPFTVFIKETLADIIILCLLNQVLQC